LSRKSESHARADRQRSSPPPDFDPWARVPFQELPHDLVSSYEHQDWETVRDHLRILMDGVTTDGPYGRQLIQLVRGLPLGVNPLFDRYRAVTAIDYGDWDDLDRCLAVQPPEQIELEGIRAIWLAPLSQTDVPPSHAPHQAALFEIHEVQLQRDWGRYRRWARAMLRQQFTDEILRRDDIPTTRHLLYRRVQDVWTLSVAEANGGRLSAAAALARESQRLGGEGEQLRVVAHDLELLCERAMGRGPSTGLLWPAQIASPIGPSPLGTWEMLNHLLAFMTLADLEVFSWCVRVVEKIASRMASPRAQLQAEAWRVADDLLTHRDQSQTELDGLLLQARSAVPGLRVLPQLLDGYARPRHSAFAEALELARRAGNLWAQITALIWMTALNPTLWASRSLHRLLEVTGWRRPLFAPPQIAADAALGLTGAGLRGRGIVELALLAGRPNVTVEVATRHTDDETAPLAARTAAVQALRKVGTARSRDILGRISRRKDEIGTLARNLLTRPAAGVLLSEREIEVLGLTAKGLTNKEIGGNLGLSEHTIARHIANARNKLGAANRAEAVSMLAEMSRN
jgi:DNA-binding CsgD family transcriptional regulator